MQTKSQIQNISTNVCDIEEENVVYIEEVVLK